MSLSTLRRHHGIAEQRLRLDQNNLCLHLALPLPCIPNSGESLTSDSTTISFESTPEVMTNRHTNLSHELSSQEEELSFTDSPVDFSHNPDTIMPHSFSFNFSSPSNGHNSSSSTDSFQSFIDGSMTESYSTNVSACDNDLISIATMMEKYGWHCGYFLRHRMTHVAMEDLLRRDFPAASCTWETVRNREIALSGIEVTRHKYCGKSHEMLNEVDNSGVLRRCSHKDCNNSTQLVKELSYIRVWSRILSKLQNCEEGPILLSYVKRGYHRSAEEGVNSLENFYSGRGFQEYAESLEGYGWEQEGSSSKCCNTEHIFVFISTDGAPAFKSSTMSFWPVLVFLGNIPPDQRFEERNIFPVMCIPGNPIDIESFLDPLFAELEHMHQGIECHLWDGRRVRVVCHVLHELCDLQARRKLCQLKGVNGYCPCAYCEIRGELSVSKRNVYYPDHVKVAKRTRLGTTLNSRRTLWNPHQLPLRDEAGIRRTFQELEELVVQNDKPSLKRLQKDTGLTGQPEIVRRFASIRPYLSMPIDLMHLLFENVAPLMLKIWMGEVDTTGVHSYLRSPADVQLVDNVLQKSGSGLVDTYRRPRSLKVRGLWKADEWRTFVLITSLVALHTVLPNSVLSGWWSFCQICELSMRRIFSSSDVEKLQDLCESFFRHYSDTYYEGRSDRIHLMRYTIHLLLHIPLSTQFCGPLVCLSQFATERYIGLTKEASNAKHRYSESLTQRWVFQQAVFLCSSKVRLPIPLMQNSVPEIREDRSSKASNKGRYEGYYLRGPHKLTTLTSWESAFGYRITSYVERFYVSDLSISRQEAALLLREHPKITSWERLIICRTDELIYRKYSFFKDNDVSRSCAFIAGEFDGAVGDADLVDVYYGRIAMFFEHRITNPRTGCEENRVLVLADWAVRGLHVGNQQQIYSNGIRSSSRVFQSRNVEDVSCISRNIAVIEAENCKSRKATKRTYFVDEFLNFEKLLDSSPVQEQKLKKQLRGIAT